MPEIIFTKKATDDLVEQALYLLEKSGDPKIAQSHIDQMEEFLSQTLKRFPNLGHPTNEYEIPDIRKLVYKRYTILYRSTPNHIIIITIYRQNIPTI